MTNIDWKNATPEQINFWKQCNGLLPGWDTIVPLFYIGAVAGSEFVTYDADKLYLALELEGSSVSVSTDVGFWALYDMANAIQFYAQNGINAYNSTTAAMVTYFNNIRLVNIAFSRIASNHLEYMKFNGYRLTVA